MPVDEKKDSLRAVLEKKSTEELEELLALDFSEQEDTEPDVEYMMAIMEVIHEREEETTEQQAEVDAAWRDFQEYLQERKKEKSDIGANEESSHDHPCKSERGQTPRKHTYVLRYCAVVAAVIVLLCGSAYALGWNIFQALADWTEETFSFLTGNEQKEAPEPSVFEFMSAAVAKETDTPAVPRWAPEGTTQSGDINVADHSDKVRILGTFSAEDRIFTIRVSIYNTMPEGYSGTYQKDDGTVQIYESGGITHYIMSNNENSSAMWTNRCVEGYIQGDLSIEELQKMIDSIYEE